MSISRRTLIKAGLATSATVLGTNGSWAAQNDTSVSHPADSPIPLNTIEGTFGPRERLLMDFGWKFNLGNASDATHDFDFGNSAHMHTYAKSGAAGAVTTLKFDDSSWHEVNLPHDWAVDLPFVQDKIITNLGSKPLSRNYPATSIGWYRRAFDIPATDVGRHIRIQFEGVCRDATVFLNGERLGRNFSGYAPFSYDVTDFLNYGGTNVLVLRVDASLHEAWFYEGAGIYRHVWMTKTSPVFFEENGIFAQSEVTGNSCRLQITAEVRNETDAEMPCIVNAAVRDTEGSIVATLTSKQVMVAPRATSQVLLRGEITAPKLWTLEDPHMYTLAATLNSGSREVDTEQIHFGVRTIRFDPDKGFFLNGKPTKILGTCNHQDHAGVGTAIPDRLNAYRVELLRSMGSNACRTSHNPASPSFLDACDRLGMLVMEETRLFSSSNEGLSELSRMIRRDRNHPSIVIWSIANEEPLQGTDEGKRMATTMKRLLKQLDPTRPVTAAMNNPASWGKGISQVVDVQGFNYGKAQQFDAYRREHPHQPLIGTETASTVSTRGIYRNDPAAGYVSAYDVNHPSWAALAEEWWPVYSSREWLAGGFVWTGFDYRGEPTPYEWPCISSHFGIMDICGFPKDNFYYYRAWWRSEPSLHLFPHWNWTGQEGQPIDVWCFSNQDSVELFLNGTSLGRKPVVRENHLSWKVPFAPGVIEARAYKGDKVVLISKRETPGRPARLLVEADRPVISADGEDLSVVTVRILDEKNRVIDTANNLITFSISGPAALIGVGNGDPSCHESDKGDRRSAFNGLCMGLVQGLRGKAGQISITVSSAGLQEATVNVTSNEANLRKAL